MNAQTPNADAPIVRTWFWAVWFWAVAGVVAIGVSCATPNQVRELTYPKELSYLARADIHAAMKALATHAVALDGLLRVPGAEPVNADVLTHLDAIAAAVSGLDKPGRATHPLLDRNLDAFRRDVTAARNDAAQVPPRYFLAGAIAGSCRYCHGGS